MAVSPTNKIATTFNWYKSYFDTEFAKVTKSKQTSHSQHFMAFNFLSYKIELNKLQTICKISHLLNRNITTRKR